MNSRIYINAKPNARQIKVKEIDATHYLVWVTAPSDRGQANEAVIKSLAKFLSLPPSGVILISGIKSRKTVFDLVI